MQRMRVEPIGPPFTSDLLVGTVCNGSVGVLQLSRPHRANAFGTEMWDYFAEAIRSLERTDTVRALLICGQGDHFCSGIDVSYLQGMMEHLEAFSCPARKREAFRENLFKLQDAFNVLEKCKWPVIAAVHGSCVGGGVDLISACDVRVCSQDATFCVKEVDLAITADLGTLQRLPHIIGYGPALDLALTARSIGSEEALRLGLVTQVLGSNGADLMDQAVQLAASVAAKSPLALIGTKRVLQNTRDVPGVAAGLDYIATYNAGMLLSDDLAKVMTRRKGQPPPTFSKL